MCTHSLARNVYVQKALHSRYINNSNRTITQTVITAFIDGMGLPGRHMLHMETVRDNEI